MPAAYHMIYGMLTPVDIAWDAMPVSSVRTGDPRAGPAICHQFSGAAWGRVHAILSSYTMQDQYMETQAKALMSRLRRHTAMTAKVDEQQSQVLLHA